MGKTTKSGEIVQKKDAAKAGEEDLWDLNEILGGKSFDEWVPEIKKDVERFEGYRKILNDNISAKKLLEIILLSEGIAVKYSKIDSYYTLKFSENTKDQEALAKLGVLKQFVADISNRMLFFDLWFIKLDDDVARKLIEAPEIKPYKYHLISMRKSKPYVKSEEIEKIMQIKDTTGGGSFFEIYSIMTNGFVFDWYGKKMNKDETVSNFKSANPEYRQHSYDILLQKYDENSDVFGEIYKDIATGWYNDGIKIRGYKNSIDIRHLDQDVSSKAVDAMLKVIRKNAGIFIDYFKIKYLLNKNSGQKYSYSRYHLYAPYVTKDKNYSYIESKNYVLETFRLFDKRFYNRALKIFERKHVHSPPSDNKRGGAFCMSITRDLSPYILLNFIGNKSRDITTIVHELGHGIHDTFSAEKQTDFERQASLTICETASVFSEMMLAERLIKESDDKAEKIGILMERLDDQWATIVRQAYFVIFEIYAHEAIKNGATKDELDNQYYKFLKEQFGDMEIPEVFKHEWNYITHIYETPFYCYAYAWGNLSVLALYDMYRKEGKPFIEKYVNLLSAGSSDSPANLLKIFGIDVESEEFWERGFAVVKEEIGQLKKLAK